MTVMGRVWFHVIKAVTVGLGIGQCKAANASLVGLGQPKLNSDPFPSLVLEKYKSNFIF